MEDSIFTDSEGNKLLGTLSIPNGAKTVVILSHGFSSSKDSRTYKELEQKLNFLGIGTFRYDSYGHGALYCKNGRYGVNADVTLSKSVASLDAAIQYVRGNGNYKIILMGSSYGGLISLIAAAKDPQIIALALKSPVIRPDALWRERVGIDGMRDWQQNGIFHYDDLGEKYDLQYGFFKDLEKFDFAKLEERITCPILIVHGDADTVVPIKFSHDFAERTGAHLHVVKGANHGYLETGQYDEMRKSLLQFIVSYT